MAKQKKTRKQKVLSDLRHKAITQKRDISPSQEAPQEEQNPRSTMFTYSLQSAKISPILAAKSPPTTEYHYIARDLKKTAILTTAIVVSQLALFWFLNKV